MIEAKAKVYKELCERLETREGEELHRLAKQGKAGRDIQQVRVIKSANSKVLTKFSEILRDRRSIWINW